METISSNHFSVDDQMLDALEYLRHYHREEYDKILVKFPEMDSFEMSGAWLDTEAMGVDVEYSSWVIDAIEDTGFVMWEEGEPWATTDWEIAG